MESVPRPEAESRPRKSKTKGILKNGGGGGGGGGSREGDSAAPRGERRQKERRSAEPRHSEGRSEPEKKHRHRRHRDSNIYDTPKGTGRRRCELKLDHLKMRKSTTAAGFKNGRLQNSEKTIRTKCVLAMVRLHEKESTVCIEFLSEYDIKAEFKHILTEY
jgi:hypothetical protein